MNTEISLLKTVLSCMSEGVIVIDHTTKDVMICNEGFVKMWGIDSELIKTKRDDLLIKQVLDRLVEPESFLSLVQELYLAPERSSFDVLYLKESIVFERRSEPFYIDSQIKGRIFFFRDVTNEYANLEKLTTQKSLMETIISSIPYSIFWKDKNLNFLGSNERFAQDIGFESPAALVGKNDFDLPSIMEQAIFFRECDQKIIDTGIGMTNIEEEILRPDGETATLLTNKVPLRNSQEHIIGILGIYSDITDFKKNLSRIKEQESLLVSASQMSSLGEMAAGIAHEINNPLSIIKSSSKYLTNQLNKENLNVKDFRDAISDIDETVGRIAKIITGLRNISRRSDVDKSACCFKDIFEDVLGIANARFKANGIQIRETHAEDVLNMIFMSNRIQLSQVLVNLLNNSFDALSEIPGRDKWVDICLKKESNSISLTFTDSGTGIPSEVREKMFNPFYTTKEIGKGTGIGLSISKSMIEKLGGTFSYDENSIHTTFIIHLPDEQAA